MLTGGCLCGAVRYDAGGTPSHATLCHCASCRRAAGATPVAWFSVLERDFAWTADAPVPFRSSAKVTRTFCGTCGTSLSYASADHPNEIDLTICSLDSPAAVVPEDHTQTADRLAWSLIEDGRPAHAGARPSALQR